MSTRASAPRCASCGMPLAPDAESCAVCGARVPLIARPAVDEDDAGDGEARPASGALPLGAVPRGAEDRPPAPSVPTDARTAVGVATHRAATAGPATAARYDAAAAARDVRAAGRSPRPAAADAGAVPGVGPRVLAYAIDLLLLVVVALLMVFVARVSDGGAAPVTLVVVPLIGLGQLLAEGLRGATLGAYLTGLRTVDARTGGAPGVPRAFVRQLVVGLGALVAGVGNWVVAASAAWDSSPQRRGWHDRASGTAVVGVGAQAQTPAGPTATRGTAPRSAAPWTPTPPPGRDASPVGDAPTSTTSGVAAAPSTDGFPAVGAAPAAPFPLPPVAPAAPPAPPAPDWVRPAPALDPAPAPVAARPDLLPPPPEGGRRERGGARPPVTPAPAPALPTEDDLAELEHTRVRDPGTLRRRTGTLALHFDTGERVRVVGRGLVGRGPRAEDGQDILHVVVLSDAARSLSRVHAEFGPEPVEDEGAAIWVSDRGSTNGTVVVDPAGAARVLPAGARAVVGAGWTVRLGDREARVEDD